MTSPSKRNLKIAGAIMFAAAVASEIGLRASGAVDFPVYSTDPQIGYIPAPSQSGSFLGKNRWALNGLSMGISEEWAPGGGRDLLLIGDSLVWCGNPYDQPEKLGPQLGEKLPGWKVWPVGAGSWSVENEGAWLNRNPAVRTEADALVWILNSGDFAPASQWKSELSHPRSRPVSALVYAAKKYALPRLGRGSAESTGQENPVSESIARAWADELKAFRPECRKLVVIYPGKGELAAGPGAEKYARFTAVCRAAVADTTEIIDVKERPEWSASLYRDSIHPTPEGIRILSGIAAQWAAVPASSSVAGKP